MPRVMAEELQRYVGNIFTALNMPEEDASLVAENLLYAELRGIPSHGVSRIPIYAKRLRDGAVNPHPVIRQVISLPSLAVLDADGGMGQVAGSKAITMAMNMASKLGSGNVFIRNSNHFGIASYYSRLAAMSGMIAMVVSNAPPAMAAWGGSQPVLGTNPISFAFPVSEGEPIIVDMATSLVARGKIREAAKEGKSIPIGWALDRNGNPTEDPDEALEGTLFPLGGVKGYCLSVAVELLAGLFAGAGFSTELEQMVGGSTKELSLEQRIGHMVMVINAASILSSSELSSRMDRFTKIIKGHSQETDQREIFLPGEMEVMKVQKHRQEGISLSPSTFKALQELGKELSLGDLTLL